MDGALQGSASASSLLRGSKSQASMAQLPPMSGVYEEEGDGQQQHGQQQQQSQHEPVFRSHDELSLSALGGHGGPADQYSPDAENSQQQQQQQQQQQHNQQQQQQHQPPHYAASGAFSSLSQPRAPPKKMTVSALITFIDEMYVAKEKFDLKCAHLHLPRETMAEYLNTFLVAKYGLKSLVGGA